MELKRLTAENYDEVLYLMSYVFGRQRGEKLEFDKVLPKMWKRNDEYMGKHLGIFDKTRLVSALGVYPLPGKIGNENIMFSTTGNVVTHPDYEGQGCMNIMLNGAMEELKRINADVSRLGGLRQRYSRFGFEACGTSYDFTLTPYNIKRTYADFSNKITFEKIENDDLKNIQYAENLYNKTSVSVFREDFFNIIIAWNHTPYIAKKDGKNIGYLVVNDIGKVTEFFGENPDSEYEMLLSFCFLKNINLTFSVAPYRIEILRNFSEICEIFGSSYPSRFKIISYDKILDALIKLKNSYMNLINGEFIINIENYGNVKIFVEDSYAGCEKTDKPYDFSLTYKEAANFFFGPLSPEITYNLPAILSSWLPLPLGWNAFDGV